MSNTLLKIENLHTCFKTGKTIHLRKGVKFHDGSDLTAQVVKWNLEFMIEHGNGGMIYNPTIECPDDYTVVVTFDEEHIDGIFAIAQVQIYSQKAYEEHGLEWCQNNPIGTGPFVFQKYVTDRQISLRYLIVMNVAQTQHALVCSLQVQQPHMTLYFAQSPL